MQVVDNSLSKHGRQLIVSGVEIDDLMEEHYLAFHNGAVDVDHPLLDVEKFIEEYLRPRGVEYDPEARDLEAGVIGETRFNPDGTKLIRIHRSLYLLRRSSMMGGCFRFTCAHETFHAMFHDRLFRHGGHSVCLERHIREDVVEPTQSPGDFTEWQANRGAAALLMPHSIFAEHVKQERGSLGTGGLSRLVKNLAARFDVSRQSAQIRLQTLGLWTTLDVEPVLQYNGIDSYEDPRHR